MEWENSVEKQEEEYSLDLADTLRSLREKIKSFKIDNNRLIEPSKWLTRAQEKQAEVNAMILQSLLEFWKQGHMGNKHGYRQEEKTNGADGSKSQRRHRLDREDTMKSGRFLDTPNRRTSTYEFYSSSSSRRHNHHQC